MQDKHLSRRAFLAATTTSAVVASSAWAQTPNTAKVVPRKISPNEKLNVAGIGVGGMGAGDIMAVAGLKDLVNVVALCDVDWKKAEETFYKLPDAKKYKDYRKMLEEMGDQIDGCTISTPDHTHAPAAYMAMKMGKHVRVQKPLTHTIAEARLLAKTAEETGVTTAMGNQGHSGDGVRELCEMLWDGAIGDVTKRTSGPIAPSGPKASSMPCVNSLCPKPWRGISGSARPRCAPTTPATPPSNGAAGGTSAAAPSAIWPATSWTPPSGRSSSLKRRRLRSRLSWKKA